MIENFFRAAMAVGDEPEHYMPSQIFSELRWRHRKNTFFSVTKRSLDAVAVLVGFLIAAAVVAYFYAHFMLYVTGFYDKPVLNTLHPHEISHLQR